MRFLSFLLVLMGLLFYVASTMWTSALSSKFSQSELSVPAPATQVAQVESVAGPTAPRFLLS